MYELNNQQLCFDYLRHPCFKPVFLLIYLVNTDHRFGYVRAY